jgi:hypothetical protein
MHESAHPLDDSDAPYICHGYFDPLIARRILKRFGQEGVRFEVADASRIDMADAEVVDDITPLLRRLRLARVNRVELFIHWDDEEKARKIVGEI